MLSPNKAVVKEIKKYDNKLFVKWNNEKHYFEIWRKMLWGDRLITPVVTNIYNPGKGDMKYCPLDRRIVAWLYSADSQRKTLSKCWKWKRDRRFKEIEANKRAKTRKLFRDIAAEEYSFVNKEIFALDTESNKQTDTNWIRPDIVGKSRSKVLKRSAKNAKEYFKDDIN